MSSKFIDDIMASEILDIQRSVCDLTAMFKNIKILDRSTSSTSIQVLATIEDKSIIHQVLDNYIKTTGENKVFIKIGLGSQTDNSSNVERTIYHYLRKLLFDHRTPNIMRYIMGFNCDHFSDFLKTQNSPPHRRYYRQMKEMTETLMNTYPVDGDKVTISVIEMGKGKSFESLLNRGKINEHEFKCIMFQTFYTLRELHLNKVRHNDVHLGNIWVNIHTSPQRLIYFIDDDRYVVLETIYVVKIYDFDRAAFTTGTLANESLRDYFCPNYGMCENENEGFDLLLVLNILYEDYSIRYPFISTFVLEAVQDAKYLDNTCCEAPGRYCEQEVALDGTISCNPNAKIGTDEIYNIEQLCTHTTIFDPYLRSLRADGFEKRDIPIDRSATRTDIPLYLFKTNVYVSTICSLTPIQMANKLLRLK